ncbi:MAG: hypothetical protein F4160_01210 [Rhodospirillaceae bacterium]|nr:hypothetical protein [Rhodospirillaceae bacterium]MYH35400.1 hypothetical protein [Rhodospirillaceae bacterium]MYK13783.1 hypothetical protein [Rhodospirillaceae bacterium]
MLKTLTTLAAAATFLAAAPGAATDRTAQFAAELKKWVEEPCAEVSAAIGVRGHTEANARDIDRQNLAEIIVMSRQHKTMKLARSMRASASWQDRRRAYPLMLKLCIGKLIDGIE